MIRIGVISDTHGLLRPEVVSFLCGCDRIVHAGDVCEQRVLDELRALAPLTAVRGNNDRDAWADALQESAQFRTGNLLIHVIHDLAQLAIDPVDAGVQVVISGHSHLPSIERRGSVLFVNPGSAGPRRFRLPIAAAELIVRGADVTARIVEF
jgi:uncharacterized protein